MTGWLETWFWTFVLKSGLCLILDIQVWFVCFLVSVCLQKTQTGQDPLPTTAGLSEYCACLGNALAGLTGVLVDRRVTQPCLAGARRPPPGP